MNQPFTMSITRANWTPTRQARPDRRIVFYEITAHNNAAVVQRLSIRRASDQALLYRAPIAVGGGGVPINLGGGSRFLEQYEDIELALDADAGSGVDVNFVRWELS